MEAAGEFGIREIAELVNQTFNSGNIPEKMRESKFVVILNKEESVDCSRHKTISIMSQMLKTILKLDNERL